MLSTNLWIRPAAWPAIRRASDRGNRSTIRVRDGATVWEYGIARPRRSRCACRMCRQRGGLAKSRIEDWITGMLRLTLPVVVFYTLCINRMSHMGIRKSLAV